MTINIYEMENNVPKKMLGIINVRKNLKRKTITDKVIKYLEDNYSCKIENRLVMGKYDLATGIFNGGYILFGKNLPFREITYIQAEE